MALAARDLTGEPGSDADDHRRIDDPAALRAPATATASARPTAVALGRPSSAGLTAMAVFVLAAVALRPLLAGPLSNPAIGNWSTIFVAITVQALPFLVLGVVVSGSIGAFLPHRRLAELLPASAAASVPIAALAGIALPGCECGSVPVARRLIARGTPVPAALTFLLAAPAVNPVVLVATAIAFPGRPAMVVARLAASLLAATAVGFVWTLTGWERLLPKLPPPPEQASARWRVFLATAEHDLAHAGGFLVVGAALAATLQTAVPRGVVDGVAGTGPVAVLALGLLAVVLAVCSEADAFVAASLSQFSLTARLAFLVVGPMVDVKLVALQAGTFSRRFALRFAPLTFLCALTSAVIVGAVLL